MNFENMVLSEINQSQDYAWLHLREVRKQTKLMYGDSAQDGVYLWKEGID